MEQALLVMTNVPDGATARTLASHLIAEKLAACVNILPAVRSIYRWEGLIEETEEVTLLIKTVQARYAILETAIKTLHPYQLPEIIAIPIVDGLPSYLGWVAQETKKDVDV